MVLYDYHALACDSDDWCTCLLGACKPFMSPCACDIISRTYPRLEKHVLEIMKDMLAVGQYKPWNWAGLAQQSVIKMIYI